VTIPLEECPDVRWLGPRRFIFATEFVWCLDDGHVIRIPAGFVCDGASVPRMVWLAVAPSDLSEAAWGLHDYLYRMGGHVVCAADADHLIEMTRAQIDALFNSVNLRHGVTGWKRRAAYLGVRAGGWIAFRGAK
jgi:hypothetical protein